MYTYIYICICIHIYIYIYIYIHTYSSGRAGLEVPMGARSNDRSRSARPSIVH